MRHPPTPRERAWRMLLPMLLVLCGEAVGVALLQALRTQQLWLLVAFALLVAGALGYAGAWALGPSASQRVAGQVGQPAEPAREALEQALAARIEQQRRMRHDIRGVLSPVMLTADRLVNHADPAVKRSGEILLRTVDRATALLAEAADDVNPPADP